MNKENDAIICRCKQIYASEIIEAVKDGARTVEEVKSETEANFYGCAGCRYKVQQLIDAHKN